MNMKEKAIIWPKKSFRLFCYSRKHFVNVNIAHDG